MTDKNKHIEALLEHFFEGRTSNIEEQQLYKFFAGNNVPEHLLKYKEIFAYFDEVLDSELCVEESDEELCVMEMPVRKIHNRKWVLWASVAASLLILTLLNTFDFGSKPFDPYEGSFIIRNGVRITDPETIRPELEATIQQVKQQQQDAEALVEQLKTEDSEYTDVDKSIQSYYESILEGFENELVRKEVKKFLNIE